MRVRLCNTLASALLLSTSIAASAVGPGVPAGVLKQLQDVGRDVMAQNARVEGARGEQREEIIKSIASVREFFSRAAMPVMTGTVDQGAVRDEARPRGENVAFPVELTWDQQLAAAAISIFYDEIRANRFRARREVFARLEDLEEISETLSGPEWWELWAEDNSDDLAIRQSRTLARITEELSDSLDFRNSLSPEQANQWARRLAFSENESAHEPEVPMITNIVPKNVRVVGK